MCRMCRSLFFTKLNLPMHSCIRCSHKSYTHLLLFSVRGKKALRFELCVKALSCVMIYCSLVWLSMELCSL
jgi:hypothetical protein